MIKLSNILKEALQDTSLFTYKMADSFTPSELKQLKASKKISDEVYNGAIEIQRSWKQSHPTMRIGGGAYKKEMLKQLNEDKLNEAIIKAIDITFTDRGRFYKVEVDGQRRVKGYDDLRSSEESLSNLLGYDISLRSMDDRVLDKAIKDLEQKGIELTYNDAMDVS